MFRAFLEVLHDLWNFLLQAFNKKKNIHVATAGTAAGDVFGRQAITGIELALDYGYEAYVRIEEVACYASLVEGSKKRIAIFTYGESLKVLQVSDGFAEVVKGMIHGWVDDTALTTEPADVFPTFISFESYDADAETTVRVRKYLKHHLKKIASKHLEPEEYVLYRLLKDRVAIPWSSINSLTTKSWYQRLLGNRTVKISEDPKTRSVLEYVDNEGHIKQGYVIAVHPDHTILVESIGREKPGEYRVEELSYVEWSVWRPVFISFT